MFDFDVVDLGPADPPAEGTDAPDFTRPLVSAEYWQDYRFSGLRDDRPTILVFTPMVGSFLAKYVWDELADRGWDDRDQQVVGISAATPYAIAGFLDDNDYPFEIFADPTNEVATEYGIVHDLDGMAGITEPRLAFVAIDADGTVDSTWVATDWPQFPDYDELEAQLGLDGATAEAE